MPRRPRILLPEYPLHIVQRGINREPCFFAEEDYQCWYQRGGTKGVRVI
jgi:putative transposase